MTKKERKVYSIEPREMYPGKVMYEVWTYDLSEKTRTLHAICHTEEQAKKERKQVEAGTHPTQTNPGGTISFRQE
jgi:hypothetical protein